MRKISKFVLPLMMSITLLSGCGANNTTNNANQGSTDGANAPKETAAPVAEVMFQRSLLYNLFLLKMQIRSKLKRNLLKNYWVTSSVFL